MITSNKTDIVNNQNIRLLNISCTKTGVCRNNSFSEVPAAMESKFTADYFTDNKAVTNTTYLKINRSLMQSASNNSMPSDVDIILPEESGLIISDIREMKGLTYINLRKG